MKQAMNPTFLVCILYHLILGTICFIEIIAGSENNAQCHYHLQLDISKVIMVKSSITLKPNPYTNWLVSP